MDRGAIAMRPRGLVSVGLHALGMGNLGWCSFSGRAGLRIRLWGDHLLHAPRRRACSGAVPCPGAPPPAMRQRPLRDGLPSTIRLGKLSGSKTAFPTASNADGPGANPLPVRPHENTSAHTAVANHLKLAQHRRSSISPLAESARLMPVTASPMPAHAGALAGLIS